MAEEKESAPKEAPLCEECKNNPSKYKCPGCSMRTCSLPCVNSHKQRTSCTGKKQYNEVVPISQFDDNLLLSDYNMLEEVKRIADSGRRLRLKKPTQYRLPTPLKQLQNAAANRGIKLLFISSGMAKREKNRTYYNYRTRFISWSIEWRFHSTNVVLTDHRVDENKSLYHVIENHLKPGPWKHQLRQFCEEPLESLQLFIRTNPKGTRSPLRKLDINAPLREQLANLTILEYPVILVYLPSHSHDFEVIKNTTSPIPRGTKAKEETVKTDVDMFQPGVVFKEEEFIEEEKDCSLNPLVSDLLGTTTNTICNNISHNADEIQGSFLNNDAGNNDDTNMSCNKFEEFSGLDVDIHQGWEDIYCNLMGDSNIAEDLLQMADDVPDLLGEIGGVDFSNMEEEEDEELEEGEIAE